jgi:hypothetical protein
MVEEVETVCKRKILDIAIPVAFFFLVFFLPASAFHISYEPFNACQQQGGTYE